jgi:hypothetical protein
MTYKGKYRPKNIDKYKGDHNDIVYRSLWERQTFRWLDENPQIVSWSSESIIIPYRCTTDKKIHRYFVDLKFTTIKGDTFLIEIKPKAQTKPPEIKSRKTKRYLKEVLTYMKNESKWKAAKEYALDRGWKFDIWTENTLKSLGIKLLTE